MAACIKGMDIVHHEKRLLSRQLFMERKQAEEVPKLQNGIFLMKKKEGHRGKSQLSRR